MTNPRKLYPYEWQRMLELTIEDDLTDEEEAELEAIQKLFSIKPKSQPRKKSEEVLPHLHERIRQLVEDSGLTVREISSRTNIGYGTLGNIIRGDTTNINLRVAFEIADFFEIDVNELREER